MSSAFLALTIYLIRAGATAAEIIAMIAITIISSTNEKPFDFPITHPSV